MVPFEFQSWTVKRFGPWISTSDDTELIDSVCVYNIQPNEDCSQCFDEDFCRFTDTNRQQTECVCSVYRGGEFCEVNLCPNCENGGHCRHNRKSNELECGCPPRFFGPNCLSSKDQIIYISLFFPYKTFFITVNA